MTHIIWLASYPKSGNTWMRSLLANLTAAGERPADINMLGRKYGTASSRGLFEDQTLLDSGLLTDDEIDAMRPDVYLAWADQLRDRRDDPFVMKCHDAYTRLPGDRALLGNSVARGAIVVVRDPRDVALSFADHRGASIDEVIDLMCDPSAAVGRSVRAQRPQLRQCLLDWSGHVLSWLDQKDVPAHLVRYEDMEADTIAILAAAARFAGFDVTRDQAAKAARLSAFDALRNQEQMAGFTEAAKDRSFFRRGHSGGWRTALSRAQAERIETAHRRTMTRLRYAI
ncbi:MAG TPA: sulfotransferase domain-containing protein [Allosphingosinicella sp.]|nr:sulfotransferase domain-containing protein [Allosphingosinicella sp.]